MDKELERKIREEAAEWVDNLIGGLSLIRLEALTEELTDFAIKMIEKYGYAAKRRYDP